MVLDMANEIKEVVTLREQAKEDLTTDERYRLSVAYKHLTARLRTAHRVTMDILPKARTEQIAEYVCRVKDKLKAEILSKCQEVLCLLKNQTIQKDEGGVFLMKL